MADRREHVERELKLGVGPSFVLPDLDRVLPGVSSGRIGDKRLDALYYDTSDLRLIRAGVTLRYRGGDGEAGWTLKLPSGRGQAALERVEHSWSGDPGELPPEALALVSAYRRTSPVQAVGHLQTRRRSVALFDPTARVVAEVVDDEVSVLDGERVAGRFREVEVELYDEAPEDLVDALLDRLEQAGAAVDRADAAPKLVRALGPRAGAPHDVVVHPVDADASVAAAVRASLAASVRRVLDNDVGIRLDSDVEAVHQARVGTRRLRADLRTWRKLFDRGWSRALRDELGWYARLLGGVRDTDVMLERLQGLIDELAPGDRDPAAGLVAMLRRQRQAMLVNLRSAMDEPRYLALLERLVEAVQQPQFVEPADQPARDVLLPLVRHPWNKLREGVDQLEDPPPDDALHRVRILAKRARYAAEAAAPVFSGAANHAVALAGVQDVLGRHHDTVVVEAWLRQTALDQASRAQALVAGLLVSAEIDERRRCGQEWPHCWRAASRKKVRAWLEE